MSDDEKFKARITELEEQVASLKNVVGAFAIGLDKVSQIQANQTSVIEGLVKAGQSQATYLKQLVENTELNNKLLKRLLESKNE